MKKALKAAENVFWVGVLDKDLKIFDIVMETEKGTSYNSFIVKGKEKTVLFETVKDKFTDEFLEKIGEVCRPEEIDYIVISHTEPDHTGSLERVLQVAPNATVLACQTAITFLKEIVNHDFPHKVIADKEKLDIGGMTLEFMWVPMLHWPDTIFTYIPEIKALFTCDAFGCHYADDRVFNDAMDGVDFGKAYKYYFDNIMGPFKFPQVHSAVQRVKNLPLELVGTGHGPVLRKDIAKYIGLYDEWSTPQPTKEKNIVIAYVSAYGYTASLATAIQKGSQKAGVKNVILHDLTFADTAAAYKDINEASGVLFGSPTIVGDTLPNIYAALMNLNPIVHKGKFAGAFGSFGWSGEATANITSRLEQLRFTLPLPALRVRMKPTESDLQAAEKFGEDFAKALLLK